MSAETIDVHEELAEAKLTPFHWSLGATMGALTLFDGYDTFNPAYVIHYVAKPWGLQPGQAGLLISSALVGFLIGSAAHGVIADRVGRRSTLIGGLWIMSVFTLLTALFANSFASFCILRLLTGLGLGVLMPLATTYINEMAPRRVGNVFVIWGVGLGWALGGTLAGIVGVFATPAWGWQALYYVGSLSFLLLIPMHLYLPESIKFLASRGRADEIRNILGRLRPERAAVYRNAVILADAPAASRGTIGTLLAPRYRRTTLAIWTAAFLILFCIFGLTGWIPTVMMARGETFAASFGFGALMQITCFIGGLACGWIADRHGSRVALVSWCLLGSIAVFILASVNTPAVNLVGTAAAGFFVIAAQFILNNVTAQAYETNVRATAVGMELSVGRVGAILGPFVAGLLQQIYHGPFAMFMAIGAASVGAALAIGTINVHAQHPSGATQAAPAPFAGG